MDLDETLARLEAAKGDPGAMALATVDFALSSHTPGFTMALEAASIPHWFDESVLRAQLGDNLPGETDWFKDLSELTVVEKFRAHRAWNVHEVTRLALRDRLASKKPERFRELSARAASFFSGEEDAEKIERVYHLLIAAPDKGAEELRKLSRGWSNAGAVEPLQTLGLSLKELCDRHLLEPRARAYAQVALLRIQEGRMELGARETTAREAVELSRQLRDMTALVDALIGLGDVLREKGQLADALSAYEQARQSFEQQRVLESETEGLDELADLHTGVGRVQLDRGQRAQALIEFEEALNLRRKLHESYPENVINQRGVAIAYTDLGDALDPTARSDEAAENFTLALALLEALPIESRGQEIIHDMANIHERVGSALLKRDGLESGKFLEHFKKAEEIYRQLAAKDRSNFGLQAAIASLQQTLATYNLWIDKKPEQAESRLEAAKKILGELVEADPANPGWKAHLAELHGDFGRLREKQARYSEAVQEYITAETLMKELKEANPDSVARTLSLARIQDTLGDLTQLAASVLDPKDGPNLIFRMFIALKSSRDARAALLERDPENTDWKEGLAATEEKLAVAFEIIAEQIDKGLQLGSEVEITVDGARDAALLRHADSAKLYTELVANDQGNAAYLWRLSTAITKAASLLETQGRTQEALTVYRNVESVLATLTRLKPTEEAYASRLKSIKDAISKLTNVE